MKIKLYDHPFAVVAPKEFEASSVAEWLLDYYGEVPKVTLQIYKGEPCKENEVSSEPNELLYGKEEVYTVLESPGTGIPPLDAFLIQVAIAVVISVVMSVLFPPPDMPGNVNRTQQSANNSLTNRENQVRFGQRVEDIYGEVKSIPSLMMPTYYKYENHKQIEYAYYCVGRGYYDITELKDDNSLISNIYKSGARIYPPFTSPNSGTPQQEIGAAITEKIVTVSRPEQVNGITLLASNQVQLPATASYHFLQDKHGKRIKQLSGVTPNFGAIMEIGATILVADSVSWDGLYNVIAINDELNNSYIVLDGEPWTATTVEVPYPFINIVASIIEEGTSSSIQIVKSIDDPTPLNHYTDWVLLDDPDRTEVWVNVVARGGMYSDDGSGKQNHGCGFTLEVEQLNSETFSPTGYVETTTGFLYGKTTDERAQTVELYTSWKGPCRVRMKRTWSYLYGIKATIVDEIKWNDLYAVTPVNKLHFGNKTTIQTVSQATVRATNIKQRRLNCLAYRKLPVYNGSSFSATFDLTGKLATGTLYPTSKLVDILAAVCTDPVIGNNVSQLDVNQVYSVQQELDNWSSQVGQFNYTFDSDTTSFEETVSVIANAGFCLAYRQNGKIRLSFDRLQENSSALFTHRNKKPDAETITRTFSTDAEYDGVEFVYSDPTSNQSETIKLPLDESATKYKKFEIPGIRSYYQAWYRANREYQKLKGQRLSIDTTCTTDARLLLPNTRIDVVDNTRFKSYDGEVIGQAGLVLTLSRDVVFSEGVHSILLMKRDGSLDSIVCTQGSRNNQVILSRAPVEAVVTTPGIDGIRTIFSFASDSARLSQAWLVQEVGISDGSYVSIKAINYSEDYYYYDTQDVPDRVTVLNGDMSASVADNFIITEDGLVILTESGEAILQE